MSFSLHYGIDIAGVSTPSVVVEAVADDEVIGNLEGDVLDVEVNLEGIGFEEQGADVNLRWLPCSQILDETLHGEATVDDVFNDDDASSGDALGEAQDLLDDTRRGCTFVGRELDE